MDLYNSAPGVVTVYADLVCPFATFTLHGLRAARERLGVDVRLDLRAFPLELVNRRPHEPGLIEMEKGVLSGLEPGLGWRRWRAAPSVWPVTSLLPLEAVQAAKRPEVGGLVASDQLDAALRRALFLDSRCISLLPVVLEVAEECPDMDRGALAADLHRGMGRADVVEQCGAVERGQVNTSAHVFAPDGRNWANPGLELEHRGDYPVVKRYDPGVYEEILKAAMKS
ncbi:DsbA family oxidoreductase [Planosporangium mesophilum]|uniref:Dithiol-disulfide isomerase n=1 Tax=Planosporangium mesophilum TaxID=689768 RepID=A0A8J3TFA8_9ACTN|nr:dithiol-disulfide isomerase [Planosporangium mesophilum]NJC86484.1 dithiol-disulfide isomerase [Planosporangium mesophilum]GII26095.1 dithiol-disulfide isomerase [Planosporangium mesophilum]